MSESPDYFRDFALFWAHGFVLERDIVSLRGDATSTAPDWKSRKIVSTSDEGVRLDRFGRINNSV